MPQVAAPLAEELLVLDCQRDRVAKTVSSLSAEFAVEVLLRVEVFGITGEWVWHFRSSDEMERDWVWLIDQCWARAAL